MWLNDLVKDFKEYYIKTIKSDRLKILRLYNQIKTSNARIEQLNNEVINLKRMLSDYEKDRVANG